MKRKSSTGVRVAISKTIKPNPLINKKRRKAQSFLGQNINPKTAEKGIESETRNFNKKTWFYWGLLIIGFILAILDIRDNGMLFEGFGIKFACSVVGALMMVGSLIGMINNKADIKIINDNLNQ